MWLLIQQKFLYFTYVCDLNFLSWAYGGLVQPLNDLQERIENIKKNNIVSCEFFFNYCDTIRI